MDDETRTAVAEMIRDAVYLVEERQAIIIESLQAEIDQLKPKPRKPKVVDSEDFAAFWRACPNKKGKENARKAYVAAIRLIEAEARENPAQIILAGMQRYAKEMHGSEMQFVAHPATWLRGGRYDDSADSDRVHCADSNTVLDRSKKRAFFSGKRALGVPESDIEREWNEQRR